MRSDPCSLSAFQSPGETVVLHDEANPTESSKLQGSNATQADRNSSVTLMSRETQHCMPLQFCIGLHVRESGLVGGVIVGQSEKNSNHHQSKNKHKTTTTNKKQNKRPNKQIKNKNKNKQTNKTFY